MFKRFQALDLSFPVDQIKVNEWISIHKSLPEKDGIYKVRLGEGVEIFSYFFLDKCDGLVTFFKPTHWWRKEDSWPLYCVMEWGKE
jgi:hypothetical protein